VPEELKPNASAFLTCESVQHDPDDKVTLHGIFSTVEIPSPTDPVSLAFYVRIDGVFGPSHWCVDVTWSETGEDTGRIEVGDHFMTAYDRAHHFSFDARAPFGRYGRYDLHLVLNDTRVATSPLWLRPPT
jgi:hypothetical protein